MIGAFLRRSSRLFAGVVLLGATLALGACGSDDEKDETQATSPPATQDETVTEDDTAAETETEDEPAPTETEDETDTGPATSPEDEQGGAGDEEPARTLALFTGTGGQIKPRVVRVPAFISIRVELTARDGLSYGLTFPGKTIEVSDAIASASTTFAGLRPGEVLVGRYLEGGGRVRIEATAEPGP
jgi:hypothetical protein